MALSLIVPLVFHLWVNPTRASLYTLWNDRVNRNLIY